MTAVQNGSTGGASMDMAAQKPLAQRSIVRTAEMTVRATDLLKADKEARAVVGRLGGFVAASSSSGLDTSSPTISLTTRVPVGKFDQAMASLAGLGQRLSANESTQDVTVTLADQEARLKTMLAQEESYRQMLRQARTVKDSLQVQEQLMRLRAEIEGLGAQLRALKDQAAISTITLTLTSSAKPPAKVEDKDWYGDTWTQARSSVDESLRDVGKTAIWFVAYWPFWLTMLVLCGAFFGGMSWWSKKAGRKPVVTPPPAPEARPGP